MQKNRTSILIVLLTLLGSAVQAGPLGTAFTYHGYLTDNGNPANNSYDMRFTLHNAASGGQIGGPLTPPPVTAKNGLFTVTLDFGSGLFTGDARWLEIGVRPSGSGVGYTTLNPRQSLTPTPYSLFSPNAGTAATATTAQGVAQGQVVKSLNSLVDNVTLTAGANITLTPSGNALDVGVQSPFRVRGGGSGGSGGQIVFGWPPSLPSEHTYISEGEENGIYLNALQGVMMGPGNVGIRISNLSQATHGLTVGSSPIEDNVLRLIGRSGTYKHGAKFNFGDGDNAFLQEDADDYLLVNARLGTRFLGGNVGIGTLNPQTKLHVAGIGRFDVGGGSISISTPGGWPGLIALSPAGNRRDIQFYDSVMTLTTSSSGSPPGSGNGIAIDNNGNVGIGTTAPGSKLHVAGTTRTGILQITGGSDLAEPFEISDHERAPKGAVMVIDDQNPGQLRVSDQPYDKRVAGVVSGAGGLNPGLTLSQEGLTDKGVPVALNGRVYVLADASTGPIHPGDQLTSSDTPGHAMKVSNFQNAQGAVIGKAMSSLEKGRGLVLVLVTLQ